MWTQPGLHLKYKWTRNKVQTHQCNRSSPIKNTKQENKHSLLSQNSLAGIWGKGTQLTLHFGQGNLRHNWILRCLSARIMTGRNLDPVGAFFFAFFCVRDTLQRTLKCIFVMCGEQLPWEVKWITGTSWIAHWAAESYSCHLGCPPHSPAGTSYLCSPRCCWEGCGTHRGLWLLWRLQPLVHLWHQDCHCRWKTLLTGGRYNMVFSWRPFWTLLSLGLHIVNKMSLSQVETLFRLFLSLVPKIPFCLFRILHWPCYLSSWSLSTDSLCSLEKQVESPYLAQIRFIEGHWCLNWRYRKHSPEQLWSSGSGGRPRNLNVHQPPQRFWCKWPMGHARRKIPNPVLECSQDIFPAHVSEHICTCSHILLSLPLKPDVHQHRLLGLLHF